MQTHTREMAALAEAARTGQTRFNLYAGIHKALRALLADTLCRLGRTDPSQPGDVAAAMDHLQGVLHFCHSHVQHENRFVHPALECRQAGLTQAVAHDHDGHVEHIGELAGLAQAVRDADDAERAGLLHTLYLRFSLFVADNLSHMQVEETDLNNALWSLYSDAELIALHDALVATIPMDETLLTMRWMLPQMHAGERLATLQGMRAGGAPAEALAAVLDAALPHMSPADGAALLRGLGLPPVPGLVTA